MKNKLIPVFTALLYLLFLQAVNGQDQQDMTDFLRKKFTAYCKSVPREEIFIMTDRDDYIAGEEIWFSAFLVDRKENSPLAGNSIAYFEILNSENRPVVQKKIRTTNGVGSGQAILPDSLRSGVYLLRAYTNYMKNFLPLNCYMKEIRIFNAINSASPFVSKHAGTDKDFFRGISNQGANSRRFDIPGITVTADGQMSDVLKINVVTDDRYRIDNGNVCYLFIQTRGSINKISKERLADGSSIISVPKSLLQEGINQITIFDSKGRPAAESYFYTPVKTSSSQVITSGDEFNVRSLISLDISTAGDDMKMAGGSSVSVSVAPVLNISGTTGIDDYMVLASEFGIMPSDLPSGGKLGDLPPEILTGVLRKISSNWIDWTKIESGKLPELKFKKESGSHYLSGKLISKETQLPDSGKFVFMSSPGKAAVFQYAKTDGHGNFTFSLLNDERVNDLIIQPEDAGKSSTVKMESSFAENYPALGSQSDIISDEAEKSGFSKLSINYQVNRIYGITTLGSQALPEILPLKRIRFYGKPDAGLVMADYIKLPVMQEVFFELIPGASLRSKRSQYEITLADPVTNRIFETPPVLMIDGVIIRDPSLIANIDPEIVERIEVVREKYYVGDYMFFGLVNVITKSADFSCVQLPGYAVRIPYRIAEPAWSFTAPDYSTTEKKSSRIPDFRNTLFWNPVVKTNSAGKATVEFWSSDQISDYIINVQGIGADGKPVSASKRISVK